MTPCRGHDHRVLQCSQCWLRPRWVHFCLGHLFAVTFTTYSCVWGGGAVLTPDWTSQDRFIILCISCFRFADLCINVHTTAYLYTSALAHFPLNSYCFAYAWWSCALEHLLLPRGTVPLFHQQLIHWLFVCSMCASSIVSRKTDSAIFRQFFFCSDLMQGCNKLVVW